MQPSSPYRPRVSRETRLLLTAGVLAIVALWLLARIRFQERPVTPNPVPSVISQLTGGPKYDDLAAEIAQLQARLEPSLLVLDVLPAVPGSAQTPHRYAALRLRDDLAVTLFPADSSVATWNDARMVAGDPASGLVVVHVPNRAPESSPLLWTPRRLQQPRYLIASEISQDGVSLRPAFVGSLDPVDNPLWSVPLWAVPARTELTPGSFVFTSHAELVGLVISQGGELAVVAGSTVFAEADRLLQTPKAVPGTIGIEVEWLTAPLASATGSPVGVIVTWVERDSVVATQLMVGDVIEAVDGRTIATRQHWDVRMRRLTAGTTLALRVRRRGEVREVVVVADAMAAQSVDRPLGLALQRRSRIGAEVLRVDPASAADRAGLVAGDIITLVADIRAPTPAQIARSFSSLRKGQHVMIAVTRGDQHHVMTLEP